MKNTGITVLTQTKWIAIFFTIRPFVYINRNDVKIRYTKSINYCLTKDQNNIIVIVGKVKSNYSFIELIEKFRFKYDKIVYFHNGSTPVIDVSVIKRVDKYLMRNAYIDKALYIGNGNNVNLVHRYFYKKIHNEEQGTSNRNNLNLLDLEKMKVAWSLGIGTYPSKRYSMNVAIRIIRWFNIWRLPIKLVSLGSYLDIEKQELVHSIASFHKDEIIDYQRNYIYKKFKDNKKFLLEKVSQRNFNRLLALSKITVSPFGFGEVCFRDFEAILAKSLLIKPDMSHIDTWPNVYIPFITYVPVKWDLSDLEEKINYYISNNEERQKIVESAYSHLNLQRSRINMRVQEIVDFILD